MTEEKKTEENTETNPLLFLRRRYNNSHSTFKFLRRRDGRKRKIC